MFVGLNFKLIAAVGIAIVGGLYINYLDTVRISDPNYKAKVMKKQKKIQDEKTAALVLRLMPFPISIKRKPVARFAIAEIKRGEKCYANGDYDKATEHLANAFSLIDRKCRLTFDLRSRVPEKMYKEIKKQVQRLQQLNMDIY